MKDDFADESVHGWELDHGDWRPEDFVDRENVFALLIPEAGHALYEGGEEAAHRFSEQVEQLTKEASGADRTYVGYVDPEFGASGMGVGVLLEFLEVGADLITWAGGLKWLATRLRDAVKSLEEHFGRPVHLSRDALQVLVVNHICVHESIDPSDFEVEDIACLTHACVPTEPRLEIQQIYSLHTITVTGRMTDEYRRMVWIFVVTSDGRIVSQEEAPIPSPSGPRWSDLNLPNDKLEGL